MNCLEWNLDNPSTYLTECCPEETTLHTGTFEDGPLGVGQLVDGPLDDRPLDDMTLEGGPPDDGSSSMTHESSSTVGAAGSLKVPLVFFIFLFLVFLDNKM